jgi:hypothetical protein
VWELLLSEFFVLFSTYTYIFKCDVYIYSSPWWCCYYAVSALSELVYIRYILSIVDDTQQDAYRKKSILLMIIGLWNSYVSEQRESRCGGLE